MRGVTHNRGYWIASYRNAKVLGRRLTKSFNDSDCRAKEKAIKQRDSWVAKYGEAPHRSRADYSGFENDNFEVLGDTGKSTKGSKKTQIVIVRNKHTQELEEHNAAAIISGQATGIGNRKSKMRSKFPGAFPKKGKWLSQVSILGKTYYLGTFSNAPDASKAYYNALKAWEQHGEIPKPRKNNTGEKNISYREDRRTFRFRKTINGRRITAEFSNLAEAISFKHKYLGGN